MSLFIGEMVLGLLKFKTRRLDPVGINNRPICKLCKDKLSLPKHLACLIQCKMSFAWPHTLGHTHISTHKITQKQPHTKCVRASL